MRSYWLTRAAIPSDAVDLLRTLKGQRIQGLVRLMDYDLATYLRDFSNVKESQLFALGYGPFFILLEEGRTAVGVFAEPLERSVVVWQEAELPQEDPVAELLRRFPVEFGPMDCRDTRFSTPYWAELVGRRIEGLAIVKVVTDDAVQRQFPNERGLLLTTDDQRELLLSHRLYYAHPGHLVLTQRSEIGEARFAELVFREI
jgi:hypothetical protein